MLSMIDSMKLPCKILTGNFDEDKEIVRLLTKEAIRNQTPVFLVARKGLFKPYQFSSQEQFDQIDNRSENMQLEFYCVDILLIGLSIIECRVYFFTLW